MYIIDETKRHLKKTHLFFDSYGSSGKGYYGVTLFKTFALCCIQTTYSVFAVTV